MLRDVEPFERVWRALRGDSLRTNAIVSFVRFLEEKLGAEVVYDMTRTASDASLSDLLELAETMRSKRILLSYGKTERVSDEPPLFQWYARYRDGEEGRAGGSTVDDKRQALLATLAESLERHIWYEDDDYFEEPMVATTRQMEGKHEFLRPEAFAGFSLDQRNQHEKLRITTESAYLWVRAVSLNGNGSVFVPAQIVSPHQTAQRIVRTGMEPILRHATTTGLATHPQQDEARLSGVLEVIERDAYAIMWLNQLTLPRIDLHDLAARRPTLQTLLDRCARYRLRPHIVRMLTDAPAHAFCAVVEDETGHEPRVAIGLKAHRDPAVCAEKAIIEALRARRGARNRLSSRTASDRKKKGREVGHYDRLAYWAEEDRYVKLAFLHAGPVQQLERHPWESDDAKGHLLRIVQWCSDQGYSCVSVPLTKSEKNIPGWHIEMVVIPELQPLHYMEQLPCVGGERLSSVPNMFGYAHSSPPFTDEPHPFA